MVGRVSLTTGIETEQNDGFMIPGKRNHHKLSVIIMTCASYRPGGCPCTASSLRQSGPVCRALPKNLICHVRLLPAAQPRHGQTILPPSFPVGSWSRSRQDRSLPDHFTHPGIKARNDTSGPSARSAPVPRGEAPAGAPACPAARSGSASAAGQRAD